MAAVYTFPSYGLMQRDVRSSNILISPSRVAIIDFGEAILREEGVSDDEWNAQVRTEDEDEAVRFILNNRHIRDRTPFDNRYTDFTGTIRQYSEEWKRRWYNKVSEAEGKHPDDLEWFVKDDVAIWLDTRPLPSQCFLVPRPGSPESHAPRLEFSLRS